MPKSTYILSTCIYVSYHCCHSHGNFSGASRVSQEERAPMLETPLTWCDNRAFLPVSKFLPSAVIIVSKGDGVLLRADFPTASFLIGHELESHEWITAQRWKTEGILVDVFANTKAWLPPPRDTPLLTAVATFCCLLSAVCYLLSAVAAWTSTSYTWYITLCY